MTPTLLMGVVNASPDSFSDPGERSVEELVAAGLALDADIIDVGGESGVTNVAPIAPEEEIARVIPVIEGLAARGRSISVDTWKPEVARAALEAGASLVNDVSGLRDPEIADVCAEAGAGLVITHTTVAPKVKDFPGMGDVRAFLEQKMELATGRGVREGDIVLDPGPDLGKTPAETIEALRELPALVALGRPVLLAVSRKDFVGALTGRPPRERLAGTLAAVGFGVDAGASILRVHDVREVRDYLAVRAVLRGEADAPDDALAENLRREARGVG